MCPNPLTNDFVHTPWDRWVLASFTTPATLAFPCSLLVSSHIESFEACSAFTHVTAHRLAESPEATLFTKGSGSFVTSTATLIATG